LRGDTFESAAEGVGGLETLAGVLGESHDDNLIERLGDAGTENDGRFGDLLEMCGHHGVVAVGLKGELAGHHFIEGDAEGVQIGAIVGGIAFDLLGWHVIEGAQRGSGHGEAAIGRGAGDAEIHEFYGAIGSEHHVGGLNVAVDDVLFVGVAKGVENLVYILDCQGWGNGALVEARGERDAVNELHDHDELIVEGEGGAQRGDIGVIEAGKDFYFTEKTVGEIFLAGEVGEENFHGLDTVRDGVADLVDFPHASGTEDAEDFVVAEALSDCVVRAHGKAPFQ